ARARDPIGRAHHGVRRRPRSLLARDRDVSDRLDPRQTGEMPFLEHLDEFRKVLMHVVVACLVGAIGGWMLAPKVMENLIHRSVGHAVVLAPLEAFNERFKLAMILGLLLVAPYVFY